MAVKKKKKKLQNIPKGKKHSWKRQCKASESDMAEISELSSQEFKTTMINILRALMDKAGNMQQQMGNVSIEMEIIRKNN